MAREVCLTPINEAEAVFARFFDSVRCCLDHWQIAVEPAARGRVRQAFNTVHCNWEEGAGAVSFVLERELELDIADFDHISLCATLPENAAVTVIAAVDGEERTLIDGARGINDGHEYEGAVAGAKITWLKLEITAQADAPGMATLSWMGVCCRQRRERMLARWSAPYRDGWADLVLPPGETVEAAPTLGLHFGADELADIRRRAASPTWAPVVERLRQEARSHLDGEPWRGIGPTYNNIRFRTGRMDGKHPIDWTAMRLCAFVGLLDDDEALMRTALDHALAAAHCGVWDPTFMSTMPGSGWECRAFYEYRVAINCIWAWDWAGAYLTQAGRELLAQTVSMKGLPRALQTLMKQRYVRGCNQGVFFAFGAIVCELALAKVWPYGDELLEAAVKALDQTVTTYYAEDGGTFEGIGYATGTLAQALAAYQLLARHRGVPVAEVAPPVVGRISNYITAMLSTAPPYGAIIKTADGGRAGPCVVPSSLGILCHLTSDPAIPALLAGLNTQPSRSGYYPGDELNVMFAPAELPPPSATPPVFRVLSQTGLLCSCRPTPDGPVRLQLIGGPANAGHCHEDRGSFVLEAFGEEIAIDRGQMPYNDTRCSIVKMARYHNVLTVDGAGNETGRQLCPCPEASIPEGEGNEETLRCRIDVSGAWAEADVCVREIESDAPTEFIIIDRAALTDPRQVAFHLHSKHPWRRTDEGWATCGEKAKLLVTPLWPTIEETGAEDFVDGEKNPAHHLTLSAAPAQTHELRTRLLVRPAGLSAPGA